MRKPKRTRRIANLAILPNLLTLGNGICGIGAITLATRGQGTQLENRLIFLAGVLIFLGMLFDLLDGQVARLTKQTSRFGAELDSLCDMISFGVAPMFIMLSFSEYFHPRLLWGIGALYAACTALRLARYNVEQAKPGGTAHFSGLPSPAAAGTVASFAVAMPTLIGLTESSMPEATQILGTRLVNATMVGMPLLTLALAFLMVSRIRYPHVFNQFFRGRRSFYQLVEVVFVLGAVLIVHELALPLIFCCFVFAPLLNRLAVWRPSEDSAAAFATAPSQEESA